MRISDWSSDVCSSDLGLIERLTAGHGEAVGLACQRRDPLGHIGQWHMTCIVRPGVDQNTTRTSDAAALEPQADPAPGSQRGHWEMAARHGDPHQASPSSSVVIAPAERLRMTDGPSLDRKSDVEGKRVSVRVDLGVTRIIKK